MGKKDANNEITIVDEGPGSSLLDEIRRCESEVYWGPSLILVYRLGFSDRLLYRYLLPEVLKRASVLVFPRLPRVLPSPICTEKLSERFDDLQEGKIYYLDGQNLQEVVACFGRICDILRNRKTKRLAVLVIDTLQWWKEVEEQLRWLLQDAPYLGISIWLHLPLRLMPMDLLSTIGNVIVFWPTTDEVETLRTFLPALRVSWGEGQQKQGVFIYSNRTRKWRRREVWF